MNLGIAGVISAFAVMGLVLSAIGIYGIVSHGVARRTRELGVRIALGASAGNIIGAVTREAAALTAVGFACGLGLSAGLTRLLRAQLFGLSPLDPTVFVGGAAFFGVVILVAAYLPARRTVRIDPTIALRSE